MRRLKAKEGGSILRLLIAAMSIGIAVGVTAATTDNLQNLASNGGSLKIGDKTFSGFSFLESGLTSFDPSKIQVSASISNGVYYLTWDGNISLVTGNGGGAAAADLVLKYSVTATAGAINAIDAFYTGSVQPDGGAFVAIDETVRNANGNLVGSTHLDGQHKSDTFPINSPQSELSVTKDIIFGISNGGLATVSEVVQSFHQVAIPEPSTLSLLTGSIVIAGVFFLRRSRG
jgi:hypothetical protein